jgi:hypothetical protein
MKRRSIATAVTVIVVAVVLWLGGHALWNAVLVMHGRR